MIEPRKPESIQALAVVPIDLARLAPTNARPLTPDECVQVAAEIAERGIWKNVELTPTESQNRGYACIYKDEWCEMWVLSWLPQHSTGFHDHGESNVGFCVVQGAIVEQQLRFAEPPRELTLAVGDTRAASSDYIHCLEWDSGAPAVTVHVYSPRLTVVGQYRYDDEGVLRRELQPALDELTKD
jgi:hypothetical protein